MTRLSVSAKFLNAWGPGLLFAGTAIGLSHLVQATRAGALYGVLIVGVIVLIHVLKYPMFRFGAFYTAVTGESLIEGYRRQGAPAVWLLLITLLSYMFFAIGAVGTLSAALIQTGLGLDLDNRKFGAAILAAGALFLVIGRFHWLDRVNKVLIAILSVSTLAAAVLTLPRLTSAAWSWNPGDFDLRLLLFVAALGGFMPVSSDASVWQSVWTLAKAKDAGLPLERRFVLADFNVGYWGSALFAACFLVMGAAVMKPAGIEPAPEAAPFAAQLIDLYRSALGSWASPLIVASVVSVMLTTTLTGLDALPRVLVAITLVLRGQSVDRISAERIDGTMLYRLYVLGLAGGAIALTFFLMSSFRAFLDFGTTVAFLIAPVIAILNHRAVFNGIIPAAERPGRGMRAWSIVGIVSFLTFTFTYLGLLTGGYLQ